MKFNSAESMEDLEKEILKRVCVSEKSGYSGEFQDEIMRDESFVNELLKYKLDGIQFYNYLEFL